jgi:Na+/proline symporter
VGRYLTAKTLKQSRLGLIMNGFVKIPMQFLILLIGILVFTFYQFNNAPVFFNAKQVVLLEKSSKRDSFNTVQADFDAITLQKQVLIPQLVKAIDNNDQPLIDTHAASLRNLQSQADSIRNKVKTWIKSKEINGDSKDTDYIFLRFVVDHLPIGLVGLLIAIIFLASWGSIAAAINSLASCTMVDFHKRFRKYNETPETEYRLSQTYSLGWGVFCIIVAMFTYNIGNSLIEAVNILGSLFYGVILGVFLVAFFFKKIRNSHAVFWAAISAEIMVLVIYILTKAGYFSMGFLWLNPIGAFGVILFTLILNRLFKKGIRN